MLKGFIDLTFEHDGKFYIADYKSNHLGEDFECYEFKHLILAMMDHRYDLQYILYSLALHRFLKTAYQIITMTRTLAVVITYFYEVCR